MSMPLVTIMVPCFNAEASVRRTLFSVMAQTHRPIELILVDDGSTDNTAMTIEDSIPMLIKAGIQVKVVNKTNGGAASAINAAIPLATGEYIMWLDADDVLLPQNIEKKLLALDENPDYGMVLCEGIIVAEGNLTVPIGTVRRVPPPMGSRDTLFKDMVFERNVVFGPGTILVRKNVFDLSIPTGRTYESKEGQNWQLMLPLSYATKCFYLTEPLFVCVARPDSHSRRHRSETELIERQRGFAEILCATVDNIPLMKDAEKRVWRSRIWKKHGRKMLYIALRHKDWETVRRLPAMLGSKGVRFYACAFSLSLWVIGQVGRKATGAVCELVNGNKSTMPSLSRETINYLNNITNGGSKRCSPF